MISLSPSPVVHLELHDGNVSKIDETTDCARRFGANVLLEPREGGAAWRSVVWVPEAGEVAFWQSKTRTDGR